MLSRTRPGSAARRVSWGGRAGRRSSSRSSTACGPTPRWKSTGRFWKKRTINHSGSRTAAPCGHWALILLRGSAGGQAAHHGIEPGVGINDPARDGGGEIGQQERRDIADFLGRDVALKRRIFGDVLEDLAESRYSARGKGLDRARRNGVDANTLRSETRSQIAHARLEARLGEAHGVVARHDPICSEVGEGYQCSASSLHERQRRLGERRKAVATDVVRNAEGLPRHAFEK